jgi:hypothetical protein
MEHASSTHTVLYDPEGLIEAGLPRPRAVRVPRQVPGRRHRHKKRHLSDRDVRGFLATAVGPSSCEHHPFVELSAPGWQS